MTERMLGVGKATGLGSSNAPTVVQGQILLSPGNRELVVCCVPDAGVSERTRDVTHEVRLRAEVRVVVNPCPLDGLTAEIAGLKAQRLLLAVRAIQRIDVREELLGVWFSDVPRRVAKNGIEACAGLAEDIRELEFPMEEPLRCRDATGNGFRFLGRSGQGAG